MTYIANFIAFKKSNGLYKFCFIFRQFKNFSIFFDEAHIRDIKSIDTYKTLFEKSIEKTSEQKNSILTHNNSFFEKLTLNSLSQHIVLCFGGHKLFLNSR